MDEKTQQMGVSAFLQGTLKSYHRYDFGDVEIAKMEAEEADAYSLANAYQNGSINDKPGQMRNLYKDTTKGA